MFGTAVVGYIQECMRNEMYQALESRDTIARDESRGAWKAYKQLLGWLRAPRDVAKPSDNLPK